MLTVKLDTGFNIEVDFPISPFHRRMFAYCIDALLMYLYLILSLRILHSLPENKITEKEWISILIGIPVLIYYPAMEILTNGQTVGKKLLGIRVITLEGGQASISQYLLRWIFRSADFPIWIFFSIWAGALPGTAVFLFFPELPVLSCLTNPKESAILLQARLLFLPGPKPRGRIRFLLK